MPSVASVAPGCNVGARPCYRPPCNRVLQGLRSAIGGPPYLSPLWRSRDVRIPFTAEL